MDISFLRERSVKDWFYVSELNGYIKSMFDNDRVLNAVSVKGEISNFKAHISGHLYFSLKDADGQVRAVMFRSSAERLKFRPENGMKVIVRCSVSVYPRDGSYQLYVNSMSPDGVGELYLAYEQLKARLASEGLFDDIYKKEIPRFPERVGVITSPTGAAVRDIINVISRRYPLASVYLYPSLVQGDGAEGNLIKAMEYFNSSKLVDVIIIGRGGGSIEDLWAFNSEKLARKIFDSEIPVISAVGHETDFTICDFVSDLRAPTPSAAAELAVPDIKDVSMRLLNLEDNSTRALTRIAERKRERLNILKEKTVLKEPGYLIRDYKAALDASASEMFTAITNWIKDKRFALSAAAGKLNALSPLSVLSRGYSIAEHNGSSVKSVHDLTAGDNITVRFSDGSIKAKVTDLEKTNEK